jgi:hypothetical protein
MLVRSLGRSSVVVAAAAVPMHTLATQSTRCKTDGNGAPVVKACVSGMHSVVGSIAAQWPVSKGYKCSHYGASKNNWPSQATCDKKFNSIFGGNNTNTCWTIVKNGPTTPEARWVTAWLNGALCQGTNYPYTPTEIVTMYQTQNPSRANCELFFKNFMETMA